MSMKLVQTKNWRSLSMKIKLANGIKAVKYARLRVAGLERAYDQESNPKVKRALLTYLRKEKDKLSDYEVTGIYEED
ncbi:hypothetical protein HMPREF9103_02418 [Lentilactobacillus parafarraginis F0439]|uniref:Uncharacterized protein n=2 Tax=Lentilactobacillus parafarraginis TaxID=390842 RepID=G9ZRQ7_9LACO|nr:hypothetical protein HMPREF9103_02418 [Lentilactobacillus parafarraginis F0439]